MSGIKLRLALMFTSELDRIILNLISSDVIGFIDEDVYDQLAQILEKKSPKFSRTEALECMVKQVKKVTTWDAGLKILMVFHKLTHRQTGALSDFLTGNQLENLAKFEVVKTSLKTFVHTAMVPHYYKYLQKLSYNYDDLGVCFYPTEEFVNRLKENNLSLLHFISKVQNILKYLIDLLPFIEVSLTQFKVTDIVKQIAYFCLTDCYHYYTYINQAISFMIGEIFGLKEQDAFFLFELYCEHIKTTRRLTSLFLLKNYFTVFMTKTPEFFEVDLELNKRIEFYITALKNGTGKVSESKPLKGRIIVPKLGPEVEMTEDSDQMTRIPPSLQDLSHTLAQITIPSFKAVHRTDPFKPPMIIRKNRVVTSPKIRVISPTGQVQEGKKLFEAPTKRNSVRLFQDLNPFALKENLKIGIGETSSRESVSKVTYKPLNPYTPSRTPEDSMFDSSLSFKGTKA